MAVRWSGPGQSYSRSLSLGSTSQFSLALWAKISANAGTFRTIVFLGDGQSDYWTLDTGLTGTTLSWYDDTTSGDRASRAVSVGAWCFVGLSVNGATGTMVTRLATDTSFTASTWSGASSTTNLATLRLGEWVTDTSAWFNGCVAGVKLWTGSGANLAREELEAEAWTYQPNRTDNLVAWYPFLEAETTDYSGSGNTLSGGSGATTEDGPPVRWGVGRRRIIIPFNPVPAEASPDAVDAAAALPAPSVSAGAGASPSVISLLASVPAPSVSIDGGRQAFPEPVEATVSLPEPTVFAERNITVVPEPVFVAAELPDPDAVVPFSPGDLITDVCQVEYAGTLFGTPTVRVHSIKGWDGKPAIDSTNTDRANRHGAYPGRKFARERQIGVTLKLWAPDQQPETLAQIIRDLQMATPLPPDDTEFPIVIRHYGEALLTYGVVVDLDIPNEHGAYSTGTMEVPMLISCSDPLKLSTALQGIDLPDGGERDVLNNGNEATYPTMILPGPFSDPVLTATWPDGSERVLQWDIDVAEGETLIFDTDAGTATVDGENVMSGLGGASVAVMEWTLPPGVTTLAYETTGGDAPDATVRWRHAIL